MLTHAVLITQCATYTHEKTHKKKTTSQHICTFTRCPAASERCASAKWAAVPGSSAPRCGFKRDPQIEPMTTMHVPYPSAGADLR